MSPSVDDLHRAHDSGGYAEVASKAGAAKKKTPVPVSVQGGRSSAHVPEAFDKVTQPSVASTDDTYS